MALTIQQQAVVDSKSKKIIVLSCAGSGKTTVIVNRIMRLKEEECVRPEQILSLTFSNKATQEMKKRIKAEDESFSTKVNVKTFHAFGLEVIRQHFSDLGFANPVKIAKKNDVDAIIKEIFKKKKVPENNGLGLYSYIKASKSFEEYEKNSFFDEILVEYSEILKERCLVDMDDMIYLPVILLSQNDSVRKELIGRYKYIFVDEYQDTNEAQNRFLNLLESDETNLCLVGDDDQAIYEWRGARPKYIREKATSGVYECLKLEKNFRSQKEIINVANRVISKNVNRVEKTIGNFRESGIKPAYKRLPNQFEEGEWIAETVKELISSDRFNPSDIAILYRKNEQAEFIANSLAAREIESETVDVDDNARYSHFINVLQSILDLSSVNDMSEALNFPTRCLDQFTFADAKQAYCDVYGQNSDFDTLKWIDKIYLSGVDFEGSEEFRERYALITQLHSSLNLKPTEIIAYYLSYLERKGYNKTQQEKYIYVLQTFDIAKNYEEVYEKCSLKDFLDHLALSYENNDVNRSPNLDAVNLMTMHRSKGLEFKVVFIAGVQVGLFPNDYFIHTLSDLEAERRLFYVAITRAKELLYFSSFRDALGGSFSSDVVRHGFMAEIPETALGPAPTKKELIDNLPVRDNVLNEKVTFDDVNKVINRTIKDNLKDIQKDDLDEVLDVTDEVISETLDVIPFDEIFDEPIENVVEEENVDTSLDESDDSPIEEKEEIVEPLEKTEHHLGELTEEQVNRFLEESFVLSKNISIPDNCFIVIIGAVDMKISVLKAILKANSFGSGQVELYDYDGKGFNVNKYFNNQRCLGIVMGPEAHKIEGVDNKSLKSKLLVEEGYPYTVDLIHKHITKKTLQEAIAKIKWNYSRNSIKS